MHVAPIPKRVIAHSRWLSPVGGGVLKYLSFIIALFLGLVKVDYIPPCSRSVENNALFLFLFFVTVSRPLWY